MRQSWERGLRERETKAAADLARAQQLLAEYERKLSDLRKLTQ